MDLKSDCIFCKIIRGDIPADIVYRDEKVLAFKDLSPLAPLHYLFVPTNHVNSLAQVGSLSVISDIYSAILKVAEKEKIKEDGFRTVINTGKQGGQSVFHLHVHLLAKQTMGHKFA